MKSLVLGTFVEFAAQIPHTLVMLKSLRKFGGNFKNVPVWIYCPENSGLFPEAQHSMLKELGAEIHTSTAPEASLPFYFSRKVFASAVAEEAAAKRFQFLVWLDDDTVFFQEPTAFQLPEQTCFGYRPVMHQNIGSLASEPLNAFWSRIFHITEVDPEKAFPVETPSDRTRIRAYFNAGILVVRPERKLLRYWAAEYPPLYCDAQISNWCIDDERYRIFLHQAALTATVLKHIPPEEMTALPNTYNYPIFFKDMFGGSTEFKSIQDAVTIRYEHYFQNPASDWVQQLKGPREKIQWIKTNLDPRFTNWVRF